MEATRKSLTYRDVKDGQIWTREDLAMFAIGEPLTPERLIGEGAMEMVFPYAQERGATKLAAAAMRLEQVGEDAYRWVDTGEPHKRWGYVVEQKDWRAE